VKPTTLAPSNTASPSHAEAPRGVEWALFFSFVALAAACGEAVDELPGAGGSGSGPATGFAPVYAEFRRCAECHAPGAPGRSPDIESTQDWSTQATAFASLKRNAAGLQGNFEGCNGVPLIGASADKSLLVASLDADVRERFEVSVATCTPEAISDQTLKLSPPISDAAISALKAWIDDGAPM
jgi:hypothetical protein